MPGHYPPTLRNEGCHHRGGPSLFAAPRGRHCRQCQESSCSTNPRTGDDPCASLAAFRPARPRPSSAPASIPTPPPGPFEQTLNFCQDLPPPRTPHRSQPPRNRPLRRRVTRKITAWWAAYKLGSTIVTTALLLFLVGLAVYATSPYRLSPSKIPCLLVSDFRWRRSRNFALP